MIKKLLPGILLAASACGTGTAAYAEGLTLKGPAKIAMVYISPRNDGGWTQAFEEARVKVEKSNDVQIPFVEGVPEVAGQITPAAERFRSASIASIAL